MWYFLSKGPDPQRGGSVYTAIWYNQRTHTCVNINQFIRYARISGQRHNVLPPKIISTMKRHGYTSHSDNEWTPTYTGGNRTMVAAATIVRFPPVYLFTDWPVNQFIWSALIAGRPYMVLPLERTGSTANRYGYTRRLGLSQRKSICV